MDCTIADVLEFQTVDMIGALVADGSDKPSSPIIGQRKDGQKISLVEIDVEFTIDCRTCSFDVRDVENLRISSAGETCADGLAYNRTRAVAAGDIAGFT